MGWTSKFSAFRRDKAANVYSEVFRTDDIKKANAMPEAQA